MPKALQHRKAEKIKIVVCPICDRKHTPNPDFGPFCCASCLQTAIRPLVVTVTVTR